MYQAINQVQCFRSILDMATAKPQLKIRLVRGLE